MKESENPTNFGRASCCVCRFIKTCRAGFEAFKLLIESLPKIKHKAGRLPQYFGYHRSSLRDFWVIGVRGFPRVAPARRGRQPGDSRDQNFYLSREFSFPKVETIGDPTKQGNACRQNGHAMEQPAIPIHAILPCDAANPESKSELTSRVGGVARLVFGRLTRRLLARPHNSTRTADLIRFRSDFELLIVATGAKLAFSENSASISDVLPRNSGGLNGSTQHRARTHLALKTKAKNAR